MKINDLFRFADKAIRQSEDCFENKLFCAQMMSTHTCAIDSKYGYLDGAKDCLESYKPIEELEEYINEFETSQEIIDEYDRAYISAYRDYIKQESLKKESVTNE